jgi:hypothetical protein
LVALPGRAITSAETTRVFYPPTIVAMPRQRPSLRVVATRLTVFAVSAGAAVLAAMRRTVGNLLSGGRACVVMARHIAASWRRFYPRRAIAAVASFGRSLAKPAYIIGRGAAVILPCLVIYAALDMTPATNPPRHEPPLPLTTSAAASPVALSAPAPRQTPAEPRRAASTLTNVKIIDAPLLHASCEKQTWPYVTQRCLAARNGQIDLKSDPGVARLNAARNAMASADPKADVISKTAPEPEISKPVKTRSARRDRRHRR